MRINDMNVENGNYNTYALNTPDLIDSKFKSDFITLKQLIDMKRKGAVSCDYYRQRATCSWTRDQVNKMLSWVCNEMPLPQIYICEKFVNGNKYKYIIDGNHRVKNLELFLNDQIVIKKNGAEHTMITYRDYVIENGEIVKDEYGSAKFELKQFDIIGKPFSEFPEDLKDRIYSYNIAVTTFLFCNDEDIAYYMRNYNNHTQMNIVDKAMTSIHEDIVIKLNSLSRHDFFRDKTAITKKSLKGGGGARTCVEVIMMCYYMNEWNSDFNKNIDFFDNHVTDIQFATLERELDRLYEVVSEKDKKLFRISNTYLYLALFHRFTKYEDIDDERFIDFLHAFNDGLNRKWINGDCYEEVIKLGGSKKRSTVERKLLILTDLMEEYLGLVDENDCETEEKVCISDHDNLKEYVDYLFDSHYFDIVSNGSESYSECHELANRISEYVDCDDSQTLEYLTTSLDDYIEDAKVEESSFISIENTPALIKMISYFEQDKTDLTDIIEWFEKYSLMYSCTSDEYNGKDSNYRYSRFISFLKDMIELSVNQTVA